MDSSSSGKLSDGEMIAVIVCSIAGVILLILMAVLVIMLIILKRKLY